jgi:hypothetical protein
MPLPVTTAVADSRAVARGTSTARPDRCRRYHVHRVPQQAE